MSYFRGGLAELAGDGSDWGNPGEGVRPETSLYGLDKAHGIQACFVGTTVFSSAYLKTKHRGWGEWVGDKEERKRRGQKGRERKTRALGQCRADVLPGPREHVDKQSASAQTQKPG